CRVPFIAANGVVDRPHRNTANESELEHLSPGGEGALGVRLSDDVLLRERHGRRVCGAQSHAADSCAALVFVDTGIMGDFDTYSEATDRWRVGCPSSLLT